MNDHPLGYLKDDIEIHPLVLHMLIQGTNVTIPQEEIEDDLNFFKSTLLMMMKAIQNCKGSQ